MIKCFKNNKEYFNFINRNKSKYKVLIVKLLKNSIKVEYEKLS